MAIYGQGATGEFVGRCTLQRCGCGRRIFPGITPVSKYSLTTPRPVGTLVVPGATESVSAGKQPDKGYPGRRCAQLCILTLVVQRRQMLFFFPCRLDTGVMPPKIPRRKPRRLAQLLGSWVTPRTAVPLALNPARRHFFSFGSITSLSISDFRWLECGLLDTCSQNA